MRRTVVALAVPVLVALGGCSAPDDPAPLASTTTVPTSTVPPAPAGPAVPTGADAVSADDLFIAGLQSGGVQFTDPATMKLLGQGICAELSAGNPLIGEVDAVSTGSNGKWDQGAAGAIVGTSIGAYCPQFKNLLPS